MADAGQETGRSPEGHMLSRRSGDAWRVGVTALIFAISVGLSFGMMYLPCHQDFCLWDSDPQGRWDVQVSLIVYFSVLFAFAVFAWADERFSTRKFRYAGLSRVQWAFGTCCVALIIFSFAYWAAEFYIVLNTNPFYQGWMSDNWVRRPTYYATQVTGAVVACTLGLLLITSSKNSVNSLFLAHDEALPFHRWLSWFFVVCSLVHMAVYFYSASVDVTQGFLSHILNTYDERIASMFQAPLTYLSWGQANWVAPLGTYATLVMIIPTLMSLQIVRRSVYSWFYFSHWAMMAGFVLLCLHATMDFYFSLPGLCLLVSDWTLRIWRRVKPLDVIQVSTDELNGMMQVDIDASKRPDLTAFTGGQFVRLCFPSVSLLEWHPLSLVRPALDKGTVPPSTVSLMADSKNGDWKRRVASAVSNLKEGHQLKALVEGPYGSEPFKGDRLEKILCFAAGSGITPCLAVAQQFSQKSTVVWSVKSQGQYTGGNIYRGIHMLVFQTRVIGGDDVEAAALLHSDQAAEDLREKDRLTEPVIFTGRIPFARVLEEQLSGVSSAGVYICGPASFNRVAKAHVKAFQLSNEGKEIETFLESYYY